MSNFTRLAFWKRTIICAIALLGIHLLKAQPEGYYNGTEGLKGEFLKTRLHEIIKGHIIFPYTGSSTDVWDILKETDRNPNNASEIICLYSGFTYSGEDEYRRGNGWTREHVWAKSHGDFGTDRGAGTDVHALRAVDVTVNSARNNKDFDWGGEFYIDGDGITTNRTDSDSWEPRDPVKGDVARMIFYMATRYEGDPGEPDLEIVDTVNTVDLNAPGKGFHGKLSALLAWHKLDPVDDAERRRNDIIFSFQNNRNPYIDRPEFVSLVWEPERVDTTEAIDTLIVNYYKPLQNTEKDKFRETLTNLIKNHTEFPYTASTLDVWDLLKLTEADPDTTGNVLLFYTGWSIEGTQEFNNGRGWSREHIWDPAHGNFGTSKGPGTDLHAIRAVDISVGRARGEKDFDTGGEQLIDGGRNTNCYTDEDSWEPRSEVKGDVARMLFYMDLRYEGLGGEPDLILVDNVNTQLYNAEGKGYHGKLSTLIKWHEEDPVDEVEKKRNTLIYRYQLNRNPFVDNPDYVYRVWDTSNLPTLAPLPPLSLRDELAAEITIFPNPAIEKVTVRLPRAALFDKVRLSDLRGRIIFQKPTSANIGLDVKDLPRGMYMLQLIGKGFVITKPLRLQ